MTAEIDTVSTADLAKVARFLRAASARRMVNGVADQIESRGRATRAKANSLTLAAEEIEAEMKRPERFCYDAPIEPRDHRSEWLRIALLFIGVAVGWIVFAP